MNKNKRVAMVVMVVLLAGLGWGAWRVDASAVDATDGTIAVNTLDDELNTDGDCSLREAIEAANTNLAVDGCAAGEAGAVDSITFEVEGTIKVAERLVITAGGPLVMDGGNKITISGGETTRVISVRSGSTLTLQHLIIADGYISFGFGAGLYAYASNVTILECQFLRNRMGEGSRGGGIYSEDGILTVTDSFFEGNGSSEPGRNGGGGFIDGGKAEFIRTTFTNNEGTGVHGVACVFDDCIHWSEAGGGGLYVNYGSVIIRESSFIANTGGEGGGGVLNRGNTTIINSTFSNNIADGGEYSMGGGGIRNEGNLTLINSTLSKNDSTAGTGGGITGNAYIANSIIADNFPADCAGSISDGGHNISSDDTCGFDIANGSLPNTDPTLGPLQDNGGPTLTYALLDGSPAIDAGSSTNCPETDQRGMPRPSDGDGDGEAACDIGSFERGEGITFYPVQQSSSGALGATVVYSLELYNFTNRADSFTLALGSHAWETNLSADQIGPLEAGMSQTFTVSVTIPLEADWYQTDSGTVTATSISNPGEYSASAQVTTQAYAPPQISVDPLNLESNQFSGQSVTQTLIISNGNVVTLNYRIDYPRDNGVLLLHLDEPDGATTFYDSSGYGNNGMCTGDACPTAGVPGKYGSAVHFDGVNDYISVANAPGLNPQNAITISAWILADDWDGNRRIVQKGAYDNQYRLLTEYGVLRFIITSVGQVITTRPSPGSWHHVVGLYDGTRMQLWVDGVLQVEEYMSGLIPTTTDPVYIGTKYPGSDPGDCFFGNIDEVHIFERALSPGEIQLFYTSYIEGEVPTLTIDPISGSVPTNSSLPIQVTFDATMIKPGSYSTILAISSNAQNPYLRVPVTMNVLPPYWYLPLIFKTEGE